VPREPRRTGCVARLAATEAAPREARVLLAAELAAVGVPLDHRDAEAVLLVVSELVTNAVVHGGEPIELSIEIDDHRRVRLSVADGSTEKPDVTADRTSTVGGWGIPLVRRLAIRCGVAPRDDGRTGKTVWADLPLQV
jgi:anti-sigma regulatory factor (Ser/Thr protein kinase)